jgi:F-type H+-transporting ATPase subunit gamma
MALYYNEYTSGANYRPRSQRLLPVDREWLSGLRKRKWESRTIPMFTMDWEPLFRAMIREYLFVSLYQAFANSLASENASRLRRCRMRRRTSKSALKSSTSVPPQRQMPITEELLDIVSGFEAMKGKTVETVGDGRWRPGKEDGSDDGKKLCVICAGGSIARSVSA